MLEAGYAWLPHVAWSLDTHWRSLQMEVPWLTRRPSEYIREHVVFGTHRVRCSCTMRHVVYGTQQTFSSGTQFVRQLLMVRASWFTHCRAALTAASCPGVSVSVSAFFSAAGPVIASLFSVSREGHERTEYRPIRPDA